MRIASTPRGDILDIVRVEREFELELIRCNQVHRLAIAVIGEPVGDAVRLQPALNVFEGGTVDFQRDVAEARLFGMLRLEELIVRRIGELEERNRAAVR